MNKDYVDCSILRLEIEDSSGGGYTLKCHDNMDLSKKSTMPLFALKSVFKSDIIRKGGENGVYAPDAGYLDDVWFLTLLL